MIRPIIKLIRTLQSNANPHEVAAGGALGLYFGFTPLNHTHVIFLILAFIFFKINRAATILLLPLYKLLYILGVVYLADGIGSFLLIECEFLTPFWSWFVHAPVLAYLDFHYTLVLGGIVLALVFTVPVYWLILKGVEAYRVRYRDRLNNWRVTQWFKGLTISRWLFSWWPKG